jgi:hypothetical protein
MSRNNRDFGKWQISFGGVEIGVTEAAAMDAKADFPRARRGSRDVCEAQRGLLGRKRPGKEHRAHEVILSGKFTRRRCGREIRRMRAT